MCFVHGLALTERPQLEPLGHELRVITVVVGMLNSYMNNSRLNTLC
jgi:hypothetical protein